MTLLEKAKQVSTRRKVREGNREEAELIYAYYSGDITLTQMAKAINKDPDKAGAYAFSALSREVRCGNIKIELANKKEAACKTSM